MKELIDGGYSLTEINEKKEELRQEAKRMHLKEGCIYSYRRHDGVRKFFRYDGIKAIDEFEDFQSFGHYAPAVRFQLFGFSELNEGLFRKSSFVLETLKLVHSQRGMRKANRKEIRQFRREWAKSILQKKTIS